MKFTKELLYVESLSRDAYLYVGLPSDYNSTNNSFPVLYVHDAHNFFDVNDSYAGVTWGILEAYERHDDLKDVIVVGLNCADGVERLNEYGPFVFDIAEFAEYGDSVGGKGDAYLDYLVHQLKPMIDQQYRTLSDVKNTAIMGSSMGGVISLYAAIKHPDVFGRVASVSGSYFVSFDAFLSSIDQADFSKIERFYLDVGDDEVGGGGPEDYVLCNQVIYERLRKKIPHEKLQYRLIADGKHFEADWALRLPDILKFLWS